MWFYGLHMKLLKEHELYKYVPDFLPNAIDLNHIRPDFYDPDSGIFIEVKRALPFKLELAHRACRYTRFTLKWELFPDLFFNAAQTKFIREQLPRYPKPLLLLVLDARDGSKLAQRTLWF